MSETKEFPFDKDDGGNIVAPALAGVVIAVLIVAATILHFI